MTLRIYSIGRTARGLILALLLSFFACAQDGGVGGTGISTVQGNVLDIELSEPTAVDGIIVREPTTGVEDTTSDDGEFRLVGRFPVETTLMFFSPSSEQPATVSLTVPRGSELTLKNVRLGAVTAAPESIRVVLGGLVVADADCEPGTAGFEVDVQGLLLSVIIDDKTVIRGNRTCTELIQGAEVRVDGFQQEQAITAVTIDIDRGVPPLP